jgi:hypothetical protein
MGFGDTARLRNGITARALDLESEGEGAQWPLQALFISLVLLPLLYVLSIVWAWLHRARLRAKSQSGLPGLFSLWFPLLTTLCAAWVILSLVPSLHSSPIGTILLFQPDVGLALVACAATGVLWAVFRLGVAYSGRSGGPA